MKSPHRKLRIAHIITRMDWGGSPDIVRMLCNGLDPSSYDVTLIYGRTSHASARTAEFLSAMKEKAVSLPCLRRNINPVLDAAAFIRLVIILKRGAFDIVHTHTSKAGGVGRLAARIAGVRVIVHTPHGHVFYGYFNAFVSGAFAAIERVLSRITSAIIVLTGCEREDMVRLRIASLDQMRVIPNGLDMSLYGKRFILKREEIRGSFGLSPDSILVGTVGRIEHVKGTAHFVDAAREICSTDGRAKFIIAGEGSQRAALEEKVRSWGLENRIVFLGWRDDVAEFLAALDIFVLPSLNEAVGLSLIEAQASGVAVIATRVGGIPEIVTDGVTGLMVNPSSSDEIACAIKTLVNDPAKRESLAQAAIASLEDRFSVTKMISATENLYRDLST